MIVNLTPMQKLQITKSQGIIYTIGTEETCQFLNIILKNPTDDMAYLLIQKHKPHTHQI